jgi:HEAT repeat protein
MTETCRIRSWKWLVLSLVMAFGLGAVHGQAPAGGGAVRPAAKELDEDEINYLIESAAKDFRKDIKQVLDLSGQPVTADGLFVYYLDQRTATAFLQLAAAGSKAKAAVPVMKGLLEELCGEGTGNPPQRKYQVVTVPTHDVLCAATRFLGSLGKDAEEAVPALGKALATPPVAGAAPLIAPNNPLWNRGNSDVLRLTAAEALGDVGSARAVPALTTALTKDPSPYVQAAAALALAKTGDAKGTAAAVEHVKTLIKNPRGYPYDDASKWYVLVAAVKAAEGIGQRLPQDDKLRRELVITLKVERKLIPDVPHVIKAFEQALAALEPSKSVPNTESDKPRGNTPPKETGSGKHKPPEIGPLPTPPAVVQRLDQAAVKVLMLALDDPDPKVRKEAAEALGTGGPAAKAAISALVKALRDPDEGVREAATQALNQLVGSPRDTSPSSGLRLPMMNPGVPVPQPKQPEPTPGAGQPTKSKAELLQRAQELKGAIELYKKNSKDTIELANSFIVNGNLTQGMYYSQMVQQIEEEIAKKKQELAQVTAELARVGGPPDKKSDRTTPELVSLRMEKTQLQEDVRHYQDEVLYWQGAVAMDPKSISAQVGLKSARDALQHYQKKLVLVNSRIKSLEGTTGNGPDVDIPDPSLGFPIPPGPDKYRPDNPGTGGNPYQRDSVAYSKLALQHQNAAKNYEKSAEQEAKKGTPEGHRWAKYYRDKAASERNWAEYYDDLAQKALSHEKPK